MIKSFLGYSLVLGAVLALAAVLVHVLMAREYRINVAERVAIMSRDGEEAIERAHPGIPLEPELARVLRSADEGVAWFDARHRKIAASGLTATPNAVVMETRVDEEGADGWIRATVADSRVAIALRQLDLGLALGTLIAMLAGGLIVTTISTRALARVESAYQRVYRFTGDAAHEMRTPLAVIANNADCLALDRAGDGGQERSLQNIRQAARQMRDLMEGLLILARADDGTPATLYAVDVGACVESLAETYRAQAGARGVALTVDTGSRQTVYGQPEQISRIIANLVENALRFTPAGGWVTVTCTAERHAAVVVVADTGPGISPQSLARVFDRFWRGSERRDGEGAGLGLAIARSLARAHGGDVTVASRLGEGATFTVRLPVKPPRATGRFSTLS